MITRRHFIALLPAFLGLVSCKGKFDSCSNSQSASIDRLIAFAKANIVSPPNWKIDSQPAEFMLSAKTLLASMPESSGDAQLRTLIEQAIASDIHRRQFVEKAGITMTRTESFLIGLSSAAISADQMRSTCLPG